MSMDRRKFLSFLGTGAVVIKAGLFSRIFSRVESWCAPRGGGSQFQSTVTLPPVTKFRIRYCSDTHKAFSSGMKPRVVFLGTKELK
jgi:hypothetical protein